MHTYGITLMLLAPLSSQETKVV